MVDVVEFGVDIDSSWSFNDAGDLNLISNDDNVYQAIVNRLTCPLDYFELFYEDYGSILHQYTGDLNDDDTLEFIRIEVENRLMQDFRLIDFIVEVFNDGIERVKVNIRFFYDTDEEINVDLILDGTGEVVLDGSG